MTDVDGVWMRSYTQMGVTPDGDIVYVEAKARVKDLDGKPTFVSMLESAVQKDFSSRYAGATVTDSGWGENWFAPFDGEEK